MNKVILTGRITKDLELRATKNGISVCEFSIATNRPTMRDGKKVVFFVDCIVWNSLAENLCKFQSKGSLIAVFGELRTDSFEVKGEKKYKTYILVNNVEFLGKSEQKQEGNQQVLDKNKLYEEFGKQLDFEVKEQPEVEESEYPF